MVPPAVQAMPREGLIVTRKGQDVTLRCSGRGNPNPRIEWSKKVRKPNSNQSSLGQFWPSGTKMACFSFSSLDFFHLGKRPRRASPWNYTASVVKTPAPTFVRRIMGSDRRPAPKSKWKSSVSAWRSCLPICYSQTMDGCQTAKLLKGFKASCYFTRLIYIVKGGQTVPGNIALVCHRVILASLHKYQVAEETW